MVVDYDLVVIGGTLEAREAAWMAAQRGARVALVASEAAWQQGNQLPLPAIANALGAADTPPLNWDTCRRLQALAASTAYPHLRQAALSALGVDVVLAAGQFSPKPRLAFTTAERRLVARAYLIACGGQVQVPAIPGLEQVPWQSPTSLLDHAELPRQAIVLGRGGDAIATAQTLARLGSQVTLVTRAQHLLPDQDVAVAQLATALLRASGVRVQLNAQIEAIRHEASTICLQTPQQLNADRLVLATSLTPRLGPLNLNHIHLIPDRLGLATDEHLRTRNRRIYACGPVLGGSRDAHLARYEAQIAVHNALYLPRRTIQYRTIPQHIATDPAIARVGLTEHQARRWYDTAAQAVTLPLSHNLKAHLHNQTIGLCKLIIHKNGRILGGHWVGPQASEMIQAVALMMQHDIRCQHLAPSALPHTLGELLQQTAHQWRQQRWQPGRWRRDWSENWFNWRRSQQ